MHVFSIFNHKNKKKKKKNKQETNINSHPQLSSDCINMVIVDYYSYVRHDLMQNRCLVIVADDGGRG